MEGASLTPALVGVLGGIATGLLAIAGAMFLKIFKSPLETQGEFSLELRAQREDHTELAANVAVLSNEVKHLADNVKALGEEVKQVWRAPSNPRRG